MALTANTPDAAIALVTRHGYHQAYHAVDPDDCHDHDVRLWQGGNKKTYAVTYGCQYAMDLNYTQACEELGACLMHALLCAGNLDAEESV